MSRLIIGLGNPGKKYERTRHNVGFRVLDAFHNAHADDFSAWKKKFDSLVSEGAIAGAKIILLKPQTFMNNSGEAVAPAMKFWRAASADMLVVSDDLDMPIGKLRLRRSGSSGGHNGLRSIIERIGTEDVPRLKIGIGNSEKIPAEKYVLERFGREEETLIEDVVKRAIETLESLIEKGFDAAAAANG